MADDNYLLPNEELDPTRDLHPDKPTSNVGMVRLLRSREIVENGVSKWKVSDLIHAAGLMTVYRYNFDVNGDGTAAMHQVYRALTKAGDFEHGAAELVLGDDGKHEILVPAELHQRVTGALAGHPRCERAALVSKAFQSLISEQRHEQPAPKTEPEPDTETVAKDTAPETETGTGVETKEVQESDAASEPDEVLSDSASTHSSDAPDEKSDEDPQLATWHTIIADGWFDDDNVIEHIIVNGAPWMRAAPLATYLSGQTARIMADRAGVNCETHFRMFAAPRPGCRGGSRALWIDKHGVLAVLNHAVNQNVPAEKIDRIREAIETVWGQQKSESDDPFTKLRRRVDSITESAATREDLDSLRGDLHAAIGDLEKRLAATQREGNTARFERAAARIERSSVEASLRAMCSVLGIGGARLDEALRALDGGLPIPQLVDAVPDPPTAAA